MFNNNINKYCIFYKAIVCYLPIDHFHITVKLYVRQKKYWVNNMLCMSKLSLIIHFITINPSNMYNCIQGLVFYTKQKKTNTELTFLIATVNYHKQYTLVIIKPSHFSSWICIICTTEKHIKLAFTYCKVNYLTTFCHQKKQRYFLMDSY